MRVPHCYSRDRLRRASTRLLSGAALSLFLPCALPAQDTTRVHVDSLLERLERAEEAIEILREQLATQAESGVQSASRHRVELFGRVLMHGFSNSAPVNNTDIPLFVARTDGDGAVGGSVRQSSIGVAVDVDRVLGGRFSGELHADFHGGQQPSTGGRHFPLLRIRTAFGRVAWERGELLVGQELPLMAGLNPSSVAAFGTPEFTAAGNLWLWLPQLRGTLELGSPLGLGIQGAVLAPTSGDPNQPFDTAPDQAERSRRPYLQARLRSRFGDDPLRRVEIGVGVHRGWLRMDDGTLVDSEAVAVDAVVPFGIFELRGEYYAGAATRGLGGGGIGQGIRTDGRPVRDSGGWGQLLLRPSPLLEIGAGCGIGDPVDDALPAERQRNMTCAAHGIVRPGGGLLAGLTYRGLRTSYPEGARRNDHINLALGFEF